MKSKIAELKSKSEWPKSEIATPKLKIAMPKLEIESTISTSKLEIDVSKSEIDVSKTEIAMPKSVNSMPWSTWVKPAKMKTWIQETKEKRKRGNPGELQHLHLPLFSIVSLSKLSYLWRRNCDTWLR